MIARMLKAKVFMLEEEFTNLIGVLQEKGIIMIDEEYQEQKNEGLLEEEYLQRTLKMISLLEPHVKKSFFEFDEVEYNTFKEPYENNYKRLEYIEDYYKKYLDLSSKIKSLTDNMIKLGVFKEVKAPIFGESFFVDYHIGYINSSKLSNSLMILKDNLNLEYELLQEVDKKQYLVIVKDKNIELPLNEIFSKLEFNKLDFDQSSKTAMELYSLTKSELEEKTKEFGEVSNLLENAKEDLLHLKLLADQLSNFKLRNKVKYKTTDKTVYFEGFIETTNKEEFISILKENTTNYEVEFTTPDKKDLEVPTLVKSSKFVKDFQGITNMYSVPNYQELDPNSFVSVWYWLLFGIMMGDVGYGALMIVVFGLFLKLKKPKGGLKEICSIFLYCGISSIIFGVVFGSLFGLDFPIIRYIGDIFNKSWPDSIVNPINEPMTLLIISIAIGVLHIINGLALKVALSIKRNEKIEIIGPVGWILVLLGGSMFAGFMVLEIDTLIALILLFSGLLMVFTYSVLKSEGIFKRFFAGLGGLYNVSAYVSDLVSYSRILALALSTGVIAFTMNTLGTMVQGSILGYVFSIVIFLIGHLFNFAMALLSSYVHVGRLQYIEFFSKFYEGDGYLFEPLEYKLEYLDQITKNN